MATKKPRKMKAKSTVARSKASKKVAPVGFARLVDPTPLPKVTAAKTRLVDPTPLPK